ncbi:MAG: DUF262 domain-containing HNH endonuclease family protein [Sedimentisphaerales bacterium]|jgi:hypothetical protein
MSKIQHKPQIRFDQMGIGTILKTYWLKVPPHQREYRWEDTHVVTLFEDLQKALTSDEPEYFLGTIVTIPDSDGVLEVIDGQQRLATITILLSQIRHYLQTIEPELALSVKPFLTEYDRGQRAEVPKLKLNLTDNEFFINTLTAQMLPMPLAASAPISNKRLRNAFLLAEDYVKKIIAPANPKNYGDELNKWIDFIVSNAEVILLRVPTGANAYKMFETLNDRGLKTSQADLVKNYLFGAAGGRYQEAQNAWSSMIGALSTLQGEDDEKEDITVIFLRSALMAIQGFLRKNEVYEAVQGLAKGPQTVITLLKNLEELAKVYAATFYQDHERWNKCPDSLKHAIQTINDFDIKPFRHAILSVAAKFEPKEITEVFQMFVSLGVRLLVASSTRSGNIEDNMARVAHKIFKGDIKTKKEVYKEIAGIIPSDEQFNQAFQAATVSKAQFARYYLRAMESVAQSKSEPWYVPNSDKELMTLEHVLPEEPGNNWPQFTEEEVEAYCKRIGNLCLLPKKPNNDLRSANQKEKFAVYKGCPYTLTSQIANVPKWTKDTIIQRQKTLADLAMKAWPL